MAVANREELKEYALRALGAPLVDIDITDEQMEDRVDEAIAFFQEYYFDGVQKMFLKHQITAADIANGYITIPDHVWGIIKIFPVSNTTSTDLNIFDLQYQLRMNDLRDLTSTSLIYYSQVMSHLSLIDYLLTKGKAIRWNRNTDKLYIDTNWSASFKEGVWLIIECYSVLDPVESPKFWNNRVFKEYVIALFKKQWAQPLKKFQNITLPGGITVSGQDMYDEAVSEIDKIEDDIIGNGAPLEFYIG